MQKDVGDFTVNDNEVQNTMYISKEALKQFIGESECRVIPTISYVNNSRLLTQRTFNKCMYECICFVFGLRCLKLGCWIKELTPWLDV